MIQLPRHWSGNQVLPLIQSTGAAEPEPRNLWRHLTANPSVVGKSAEGKTRRTTSLTADDRSDLKPGAASQRRKSVLRMVPTWGRIVLHVPSMPMKAPTDPPLIRLATLDDVPRIRAIARAAYGKYMPRSGREPAPMAADYEGEGAAQRVVVIDPDASVSGYMVAWPEAPPAFAGATAL